MQISVPRWFWLVIATIVGIGIGSASFESIPSLYGRMAVGLLGGAAIGVTSYNDRTNSLVSYTVAIVFFFMELLAASLYVFLSTTANAGSWYAFAAVSGVMAFYIVRG